MRKHRANRRLLDNQKNEMIERLYISVQKNTQYIIDDATLKQAEHLITHYESQGSANEYNRLLTESPMPLPDIYQKSLGNKQLSKGVGINEVNRTETNTLFSYHDINEENIKIYYITPVLLYISCETTKFAGQTDIKKIIEIYLDKIHNTTPALLDRPVFHFHR